MSVITPASAASLDALRQDLRTRTGRGSSALLGGTLLWATFGILGLVLPDRPERALLYLFGAGALFPLSLLLARVRGLDPFARGNPLGTLAGLLGAVQVLYIPVLLGAYYLIPDAVPWFLGVLVGAHLLPFAWLHGSTGYLTAAIGTTTAAGLSGWLTAEHAHITTPFSVTAVLAVASVLLLRESRTDRHTPTSA